MRDRAISPRRRFFRRAAAAAGTMLLTGCQRLSESEWFPKVLSIGEKLSAAAGTLVAGRKAMAQEFSAADLSPTFRRDRKSTRLNSSHSKQSRMPSSA